MENLDLLNFAHKQKKRNYLKILGGLLVSGSVSIVFAGQIGLNIDNLIEFGQGSARTSVCDNEINIVPAADLFYFDGTFDRAGELAYVNMYLEEIGKAVSTDSQWENYLQTNDSDELLNRINVPFFYLRSLELQDLNISDCDGKIVKVLALSPNSESGPASFRAGNLLGNLYSPTDPIIEFKVNENSIFSNFTDTDYLNTLPYITASTGSSANEKNIKIDFISDYGQSHDYKFLTQSISKFLITTVDDVRPQGLTPQFSAFVSTIDGAYFRIKNYDSNYNYSFRILSQNGSLIRMIDRGRGLYKVWIGSTTSATHNLGVFTQRAGYQPVSQSIPFSQIDSSSLTSPEVLVAFARTGSLPSSSQPDAQLVVEMYNFPTPLKVKSILRTTSNITQQDLDSENSWTQIDNQYYQQNGVKISNIWYLLPITFDQEYFFRAAIYDANDNFLAMTDEIAIPEVIDRGTAPTVEDFAVIYPN